MTTPAQTDAAGGSETYLRIVGEVTDAGFTQVELGRAVGASARTVQNWAGGHSVPTGVKMRRLLDLQYLVTELRTAYTDEGIRIWLNARNRNLDRQRPIDLLTSGEFDRVLREAERVGGECRSRAMESLAVRIASVPVTNIRGTWFRHAFAAYPERALDGRIYDGRWGTKPGFPVLYLGQPPASVIVEAYRHLVDPVEDPELAAQIHPRLFVTADVTATDVLDLRTAGARASAGLTLGDLQSGVDDYGPCQRVAQVAHQLGRHGIIAPAATSMGETLALLTDLTDASGQEPVRSADDVLWETLPPDPRMPGARGRLAIVRDND